MQTLINRGIYWVIPLSHACVDQKLERSNPCRRTKRFKCGTEHKIRESDHLLAIPFITKGKLY